MLATDESRCDPDAPKEECEACARYAAHPNQTWGHWTPVLIGTRPLSDDCRRVPIQEEQQ
jgi:hypothetical protein